MVRMTRVVCMLSVLVVGTLAGCEQRNNREVADMQEGRRDTALQGGSTGEQKMDDAAILAKLRIADSLEVASAQYALTKATDATVKSYLQTLVRDHSKSGKDVRDLARRLKITALPASDEAVAQKGHDMISQMKSWAKGKDFDAKFIEHAIDDHQRDIDEVRDMQDQAQHDAVRQLLSKTLPVLQAHLDKAKALDERMSSR